MPDEEEEKRVPDRIITILIHKDRGFDVIENGRTCDWLNWDEMLGTVAALTHPKIGVARYPMLTSEEVESREAHYRAKKKERAGL